MPGILFATAPVPDLCSLDLDIMEATTFLIRKGFDKDQRNVVGQSRFLFAAASTVNTTAVLRSLSSNKVDTAAVDKYERGALHSALLTWSWVMRREKFDDAGEETDCLAPRCRDKPCAWRLHQEEMVLLRGDEWSEEEGTDWHKWTSDLSEQNYMHIPDYEPELADHHCLYEKLLLLLEVGCDPICRKRTG